MWNKLRDNGLSIAMFGLFILSLIGHSIAGWKEYNNDQKEHNSPIIEYTQYLETGDFLESVFENWESEFLQMGAYVILTAFLFQRGSAESKDPDKSEKVDEDPALHKDDADAPLPVKRGGILLKIYNNSLSLVLMILFLISFIGHLIAGNNAYNEEQIAHHQPTLTLSEYLTTSRFWFESFQNWQSEFLAVGMLVILSIWLRQKDSPESKPVFFPHNKTGTS